MCHRPSDAHLAAGAASGPCPFSRAVLNVLLLRRSRYAVRSDVAVVLSHDRQTYVVLPVVRGGAFAAGHYRTGGAVVRVRRRGGSAVAGVARQLAGPRLYR